MTASLSRTNPLHFDHYNLPNQKPEESQSPPSLDGLSQLSDDDPEAEKSAQSLLKASIFFLQRDKNFDEALYLIDQALDIASSAMVYKPDELKIKILVQKRALCRKVLWVFNKGLQKAVQSNSKNPLLDLIKVLKKPQHKDRKLMLNWKRTVAPLLKWAQDPKNPHSVELRDRAIFVTVIYLAAKKSYLQAIQALLKIKPTATTKQTLRALDTFYRKNPPFSDRSPQLSDLLQKRFS